MRFVSKWMIKYSKSVIFFFLLLLVLSLMLIPKVGINKNNVDYLPDRSEAKQGLVILEEDFPNVSSNKNAKVLIKNKSIDEIIGLKNEIKEMPGVSKVTWIDDFVDLSQVTMDDIPEAVKQNYYNDQNALLEIRFVEDVNSENTKGVIEDINALLNQEGGVGFTQRTALDIGFTATIIGVIIIIIILLLFTDSFFTSILVLVTLGTAIAFNFGSNLMFGRISEISMMAVGVIQLAVSIDYSLIFLKNLKHSRELFDDLDEAMILTTKISFKTIISSALTTIASFLALGFMNYRIGQELGLILAKGVLLSLLVVILLLPALIKVSIKWIDNTEHKSLMPSFKWLSKIIHGKVGIVMLLLLLTIAGFGYYGQMNNSFTYSDQQVDYTSTEQDIIKSFGENNTIILIVPLGNKSSELSLLNEINQLEHLKMVSNLYTVAGPVTPDEYIPIELKQQFQSEKYSLTILRFDLPKEGKQTFKTVEDVRQLADTYYDEYYVTGESTVIYDMKQSIDEDYMTVILISIIAIALILLLTFKSITIPILLLLVIQSAIWINMAINYYQDTPLAFLGYILISSIQLGSTIDYAIILTEHYIEAREEASPIEAARNAFTRSSQSILISMLALSAAGFSLTVFMDMDLIKDLGMLIGRGTLISALMSLIILPQLLVLFDKWIKRHV